MYLSSIDSFLLGYKPSCYENTQDIPTEKRDKLFLYPHYQVSEEFTMFFQTELSKEMFLRNTKGIDRNSASYIKIFGNALGYPPKATAFFADYHARRQNDIEGASKYFKRVKVNMLYCGIHFMSHKDDIEENAHWLWDRYRYEKPMRLKLFPPMSDPIQFTIPYLDKKQLRLAIQPSTYINGLTTA